MGEHHVLQLLLGALLQGLRQRCNLLCALPVALRLDHRPFLQVRAVRCHALLRLILLGIAHMVEAVEAELAELVQLEILGIDAVAEIVHELRHAHEAIRILHAGLPPFDDVVQRIDHRERAAGILPDLLCICRHVDFLGRIQDAVRLQLPLQGHKLGDVGYRVPEQVMVDFGFLEFQSRIDGKNPIHFGPVDGVHRNIGVQKQIRQSRHDAGRQQVLEQLQAESL